MNFNNKSNSFPNKKKRYVETMVEKVINSQLIFFFFNDIKIKIKRNKGKK